MEAPEVLVLTDRLDQHVVLIQVLLMGGGAGGCGRADALRGRMRGVGNGRRRMGGGGWAEVDGRGRIVPAPLAQR